MRRPWTVPALTLLLLVSTVAFAQASDPLETVLETYIVSQVTRDDGTREDRYSPATQARPGQVVEYRIIVTNVSEETLPPGIVVISVPILEGTQFVPSTATPSSDELLTEFSADDGMTFAENNVFIGLGDDRTIADPTAYTTVRWTVLVDMEPEDELTLVYRVTIR
jgi:uncharacterized repeat protein (TIGR01451 family)